MNEMNSCNKVVIAFLSILIILLFALYVYIFCHLDYGLFSVFDEGFFFMCLKPNEVFTIQTRPLSLGSELLKSFVPSIDGWDVLMLRRLAFYLKGLGLLFLLVGSLFYLFKDIKDNTIESYLTMSICVMLMGLLVMPSVVINGNDELLFFEMITLSCCLIAVSSRRDVLWYIATVMVGLFSFMAMLCSAPGGGMLGLLSFLFLLLYKGFDKLKLFRVLIGLFIGMAFGVLFMHFCVLRVQDAVDFVKTAIAQTTNGTKASHHSLSKLFIQLLMSIRDLIMTVTMLCGVSYFCNIIRYKSEKSWLIALIGITLFFVLYKWQVKPEIGFASIMTWIVLMSNMVYKKKEGNGFRGDDLILVFFLLLLPFGVSLGTNVGILSKAVGFCVPWGVLLFVISRLTNDSSKWFSKGLLFFVFLFVIYKPVSGFLSNKYEKTASFSKEYPIARMQLNRNQFAFYNEVYDILKDYGYQSKKDTILGFCFNEMTLVAMDAVPYSNDQQPEEFLLHDKDKLVKPKYMILSEWDELVLSPFLESLDWDFPNGYDVIKLQNNSDPDSGWSMTQSSLYCLRSVQGKFQ